MNPLVNLHTLIKEGESGGLEFKQSFDKETIETVCAFANSRVVKLLEFIQANHGLRTTQIEAKLNVPVKTLERWLKQLKDQNKIEFRGAPKTGSYYVI